MAQVLVGGTGRDPSVAISRLAPAGIDGLVAAPGARPTKLEEPRMIGSQRAGLALVAVSDVDSVTTPSGRRRAPVGGRLLAFRLADGVCEVEPCKSWRTLSPQVSIDGEGQELPDDGDTFVVTLPPGPHTVDLSTDADGYQQSISVLEDYVDGGNIKLLGRKGLTAKREVAKTFRVVERTSVPLLNADGQQYDTFNRDYTVDYYQRRFFLNGATPANPNQVFLVVNVFFSYAGQGQQYAALDAIRFVDKRGLVYQPRDLDPSDSVALLGFEIGADITSGSIQVGGTVEKVGSNGVGYTATLEEFSVDLDLT